LRKEEVLEELLVRLHNMGIEPLGALEKIPSLVEVRTWTPADALQGTHVGGDALAEAIAATDKANELLAGDARI
jgi:hypothetical protein